MAGKDLAVVSFLPHKHKKANVSDTIHGIFTSLESLVTRKQFHG